MKIYLATTLTHASEDHTKMVEEFRSHLNTKHEVLEFLGLVNGTATDVYNHDTKCIKECDLVLADCSYPSLGLGFEIAFALSNKKRVFAIGHSNAKISRMILGITDPNFSFMRYDKINDVINHLPK